MLFSYLCAKNNKFKSVDAALVASIDESDEDDVCAHNSTVAKEDEISFKSILRIKESPASTYTYRMPSSESAAVLIARLNALLSQKVTVELSVQSGATLNIDAHIKQHDY